MECDSGWLAMGRSLKNSHRRKEKQLWNLFYWVKGDSWLSKLYLLGFSEFTARQTHAWIEGELGYCKIHYDVKCSYCIWIQFIYFFLFSKLWLPLSCQKEFQMKPYQSSAAISPALLRCSCVQRDTVRGSFLRATVLLSGRNGTALTLLLQKKYVFS